MTDDLTNEFHETWNVPDVDPSPQDKYHEVSVGEEGLHGIILIAYHYYSRPDLWWLIATANGIYHPTSEVVPGITLRIPNLATFLANLT